MSLTDTRGTSMSASDTDSDVLYETSSQRLPKVQSGGNSKLPVTRLGRRIKA